MIDISLGAERPGPSAEQKIYDALNFFAEGSHTNTIRCIDEPGKHLFPKAVRALDDLLENVPKLMEAYAELWEMSMAVIAEVEKERAGKTASGLVLPK